VSRPLQIDEEGGEREERGMDQVLNKVGSYWFSKRASKEIDSTLPPPAVRAS
jgi:hypothetical protein